jgi:hypothetical protein
MSAMDVFFQIPEIIRISVQTVDVLFLVLYKVFTGSRALES